MRSSYVAPDVLEHLFAALMPENALVLRVSLETGLRIGDVLRLTPDQVRRQRFSIREQKTGKSRRVYIPKELQAQLLRISGSKYVFPHRTDPERHRTRQAVNADLRRAASAFRVDLNVTPHSARKVYAAEYYHRCGDLGAIQRLLNHDRLQTTLIYALSDQIPVTRPRRRRQKKSPRT